MNMSLTSTNKAPGLIAHLISFWVPVYKAAKNA